MGQDSLKVGPFQTLRTRLEARGVDLEGTQVELNQAREQLDAQQDDRTDQQRRSLTERATEAERSRSAEARAEATATTLQRIVDEHLRPADRA